LLIRFKKGNGFVFLMHNNKLPENIKMSRSLQATCGMGRGEPRSQRAF
jgi:hypothetical protein